jgi:aspartate dehydrogenase
VKMVIRIFRPNGAIDMPSVTAPLSRLVDKVTTTTAARSTKVAIAGLGAIGRTLLERLSDGHIPGIEISGVAVRDERSARATLETIGVSVPFVALSELGMAADIVIECLPAALLEQVVRPVLMAGKKVIVLSVGALLDHDDLIALARTSGGQIIVPTGALLGLDAVCAAAEGAIRSVTMVTRKPIAGLLGAPYLTEKGIDITGTMEPMRIFEGTAREAARGFPANLNVAVALSLAGIGPDRTVLEIWADPTVTRNTHRIIVESDAARFDMTIENIPSENPKTGRITPLSVLSTLRKLNAPLRVGS